MQEPPTIGRGFLVVGSVRQVVSASVSDVLDVASGVDPERLAATVTHVPSVPHTCHRVLVLARLHTLG